MQRVVHAAASIHGRRVHALTRAPLLLRLALEKRESEIFAGEKKESGEEKEERTERERKRERNRYERQVERRESERGIQRVEQTG